MNSLAPASFLAVAAPRRILHVPALGLVERAVFEALGLTWREVYPLYGHEIGAPRDYVYRRQGTIFTAEGVRRLVAHFGLDVEVVPEVPRRARSVWWWRDRA